MEPANLRIVSPDGSVMPSSPDDQEKTRPGEPTLWQLDKQMAVLSERMTSLTATVGSRFDIMDRKMDDAATRYATKDELAEVRKIAEGSQTQIGWAVKTVIGVILVGLVGLLIAKGGLPHG